MEQELKKPIVKEKAVSDEVFENFIETAVNSVIDTEKSIENKGTAAKFSSDYCNGVVEQMKLLPQLKDTDKAVIKLSLGGLFKGIVQAYIAKKLKVVEI